MMVWGDERIKQLTAELEASGGKASRTKGKKAKIDKSRKDAKERADLALREVSSGFPILHSQQVVFLWGAIEAVVEDTVAAWLKNESSVGKEQRLRKIKVSLADFSAMNETERNYHLVAELRRELRPSHRSSIEVFESILHQFGLQGAMDAQLKRNLIELEYVRKTMNFFSKGSSGTSSRNLRRQGAWRVAQRIKSKTILGGAYAVLRVRIWS